MDEPAQARAYSEGDFADAHDAFVRHFVARFGRIDGEALDLGCGPADVTVRFARASPGVRIVGVDAGENMLRLANERIEAAGLTERINVEHRHLPDAELLGRRFDAVISNSLLHHLADPQVLWDAVARCARPGAAVHVMDLLRPDDEPTLDALVERHTPGAPRVLRDDFRSSLRAAYRPEEVVTQLEVAGLDALEVEVVSDRHLLVAGRSR